MQIRIKPQIVALHDLSVSATVRFNPFMDRWEVVVILNRPEGLEPMPAEAVDAELLDTLGTPMRVLDRPSGVLVEYGGGLGTSVNARYEFARVPETPSKLRVRYLKEWVSFTLETD